MLKRIPIIQKFINKEAMSGVLLFLATVAAVIIANSSFGQMYQDFWLIPLGINFGDFSVYMTLTYWIDDGLMALFFLMVGLEIKREMMIGELSSIEKASFPMVAAIGGMLIPALIYVGLNPDNPLGFGVPMATDIAFALSILMVLGNRVSITLKVFLVALAVVDDLGAITVVALVYSDDLQSQYFLHAAIVYAAIWALNIKGVTKITPYLILGAALWVYVHAIGIHATIAGVLLAFAIPIRSNIDEKKFITETREDVDDFEEHIDKRPVLNHHQIETLSNLGNKVEKVQNPLVRLEHNLHSLSAFFIMPLFAFSNAGVVIDMSTIHANMSIVMGVMIGLFVGKPLGIFGLTYLAHKFNIARKPDNITWSDVVAAGFIAGIGFTMSIFITHLAFVDEGTIAAVKLGIFVASFSAAVVGVTLILRSNKKKEKVSEVSPQN